MAGLGLGTPQVRAWVMYDWANSAFITTILTAVFPIYFQDVAASGMADSTATSRYAGATTLALVVVAVLAPILGALADATATRKRWLGSFVLLGVVATAALYLVREGDWLLALVLFAAGNIGASGSFVFYDSLLPHIAAPQDLDRVSSIGYGMGYLGGGVLLAANLTWLQYPHVFGLADGAAAARLSFLSVALWWGCFSLPILRRVGEPPRRLEAGESTGQSPLRMAGRRLWRTLRSLRRYRQAFLFLVAALIYQDAIVTIQRMAAIYGREIGLPPSSLIGAILLVQFVGVPCAWLFASLAAWTGTKRAILAGLSVFLLASILGYRMKTVGEFYLLAAMIGLVQGGTQALSRSLFASMVPAHRSSEFFGFFGLVSKFAGLFGPAVFAVMTAASGSSREAILSLVIFFVFGGLLLVRVDVDEGQRVAREAEDGVVGAHG